MAVFVFESAAARAGVIASYSDVGLHGSIGFLLCVGRKVGMTGLKPRYVRFGLNGTLRLLAEWNECPEEERKHILIERLQH